MARREVLPWASPSAPPKALTGRINCPPPPPSLQGYWGGGDADAPSARLFASLATGPPATKQESHQNRAWLAPGRLHCPRLAKATGLSPAPPRGSPFRLSAKCDLGPWHKAWPRLWTNRGWPLRPCSSSGCTPGPGLSLGVIGVSGLLATAGPSPRSPRSPARPRSLSAPREPGGRRQHFPRCDLLFAPSKPPAPRAPARWMHM